VIDFSGDVEQITIGQSVRLHWSVTDATAVRIDPGFATLSAQGETDVSPKEDTEYTLTAEGPGGTASRSFTVRVAPSIAAFKAETRTISQCDLAILSWTVYGASTISIDPDIGRVLKQLDYRVVRPLQTTQYVLTAAGEGGTVKSAVTVQGFNTVNPACGHR
jgi:hypothetical protein